MKMNKKELIDAIAEKANISKKEAGEVLDATLDVIKEAVAKDDKVQLIGFVPSRLASARQERAKTPVPAKRSRSLPPRFPPSRPVPLSKTLSTNNFETGHRGKGFALFPLLFCCNININMVKCSL